MINNTIDNNKQISCISHEIRNNISICEMYSQIIKKKMQNEGINNPTIDNAIDCLQKSIQMICANITDLKSINYNAPCILNLKSIVSKCIELAQAYIEDKKIVFKLEIDNNINIYIDENRFSSCIINLIKNAIESIEKIGEISFIAKIENKYCTLSIINTGEKIPDNMKDKIFSYGYTTKDYGSGFGLYICKQYLESQNATISLAKSDNTTFEIKIPL